MGKVFATLGVAFLLIILMVGTWYAATMQLAYTWSECWVELDVEGRMRQSTSLSYLHDFFADTVDCVDERKGFLAGLVFDRDEAMEKLEENFRRLAAEQARAEQKAKEYEEATSDYLNEMEYEQHMQDIQEGVYQGQQP